MGKTKRVQRKNIRERERKIATEEDSEKISRVMRRKIGMKGIFPFFFKLKSCANI